MAISKSAWDFGAADGERVHCVVLLATPDRQASRHLAVLAAFARLFITQSELKGRLIAAASPEEVYLLLQSEEAATVNYHIEERPESRPWSGGRPARATDSVPERRNSLLQVARCPCYYRSGYSKILVKIQNVMFRMS